MPVTIIVGGQYGSEGKGKIVSYLSNNDNISAVVRCGGPNAGHSIIYNNRKFKLRQIPCGVTNKKIKLLMAAGSVVNPEILFNEIKDLNIESHRIGVDENAIVLNSEDIRKETYLNLNDEIGSTLSGTGYATIRKILRKDKNCLAKNNNTLSDLITSVSCEINSYHDRGKHVIIEGTQGFGLSLHHGYYPYVTSRDTCASEFISEAGVSPLIVNNIIMVIRTYPIRVHGNSGPLHNEITWEEITKRSGYPYQIEEYTSVTGKLRRVAEFNLEIKKAIKINRPNHLALHGIDYINYKDLNKTKFKNLSKKSQIFIDRLEDTLNIMISFIFTGPGNNAIIDRR